MCQGCQITSTEDTFCPAAPYYPETLRCQPARRFTEKDVPKTFLGLFVHISERCYDRTMVGYQICSSTDRIQEYCDVTESYENFRIFSQNTM